MLFVLHGVILSWDNTSKHDPLFPLQEVDKARICLKLQKEIERVALQHDSLAASTEPFVKSQLHIEFMEIKLIDQIEY